MARAQPSVSYLSGRFLTKIDKTQRVSTKMLVEICAASSTHLQKPSAVARAA
jgi:hypothetical protein